MKYIDFDGVILDTEDLLFYEWRKNPNRHNLSEGVKINYIINSDWRAIVNEAPIINDSINILKNMDPSKSAILTKVHSMDNEGYEKIYYLRCKGVKQNIILVPYMFRKCDIVNPIDNILIDDCLKNLDEWLEMGGYPMLFDRKKDNMDSWGVYNKNNYQRVLRIDEKIKR